MAIYRGPGGSGDATTDAANQASVATAKAAEATTSANAAASSATSADNSATASSTSASNSATSATASASSATASASSATAAASSATAAAASFDSFDDRYLGAKSSAPTTDNDGNALAEGAMYYDTGDDIIYVWNGTTWQTITTGSGGLQAANNLSDVNSASASRTNLGLAIGSDVQAFSSVLAGTTASYTTAEETKLAGIEASADVTDATNVTAAGALMDSEVANLAQVKAFDSTDYATAAQGTLANSAVQLGDSPSFAGLTVDTDTLAVDSTNNRVGIGTTSPSRTLHIKNTAAAVRLEDTDQAGVYHEIIENSGQLDIRADQGDTSSSGNMLFSVGGSEAMRIDSAGKVGVGTTSPANKLEVTGAIVAQGAVTAYTNTGLYLQNKGSSVVDVGAWRSGASVAELSFSTDSGSDAAPVERMRIDSSGNVLIGATGTASTSYGAKFLKDSSASEILAIHRQAGDGDFIQFARGGNDSGKIKHASGNLIINSVNDFEIETNNGTNAVHVGSNGKVGIGTASPAATVDVSGNARGAVTTDNDLSFDLSASNNFNCTPTGGGTLTFTNHLAGQSGFVWLDNSGGHAIAAAGTTKINAADLTAISTAGVYTLAYFDNGTNAYVSVSRSFA
jgi:hypothetical protein